MTRPEIQPYAPTKRAFLIGASCVALSRKPAEAMILKRDQTFKVVFNVRTPNGNGGEEVGSGIFVSRGDSEAYLVTASHVANSTNSSSLIVVSDSNDKAHAVSIATFDPGLQWQHHPTADLAILKVKPSADAVKILQSRCFPYDHFDLDRTQISRDAELTSVGFPMGLGTQGNFGPLTFRSHAASGFITLPRFDTKVPCEFFILENPSVGGYSGCPVFDLQYTVVGNMTSTGGRTWCLGIMHGTISDQSGGKMAAVTPSFYLKDLLGPASTGQSSNSP